MTLVKKIFRDLISLKGQVFTIALVVCSGISVLIASFSTYQSLSEAQAAFYTQYHFADVFASLKQAPDELTRHISTIPGVGQSETRIVKDVILDLTWLSEPAIGRFISIPDSGVSRLNKLALRQGRWLDPARKHEVLVNEGFARENAIKPGDHVVALLHGHRETLQVVGIVLSPEYVYAIRGDDLLPDNRHFGIFWMNQKAMAAAFDMQNAFNDIVLTLAPGAVVQSVQEKLEAMFLEYGLSASYTRKDQISDRFVSNEIMQQKIIATFIPPIFLMVAAFLLNIVTSRLVMNQRGQIATLKALGYENLVIGLYYMILVTVIVLLGAVMGVALGAWFGKLMTDLYAEYFRFPIFNYVFSTQAVLIGVLVSTLAAGVGAMWSVYQVVMLAPAVAMRPASPAAYRALMIERYQIIAMLPASVKMVFRYIVRHAMRTMMTSVGIALAMAIVVLGLFWQDSIRYLINTQFLMSQREDATISFIQALQDDVINELKHYPGILHAEGYRVVPIRITSQNYTEQTAFYGIPDSSVLKVLLDERLNAITVPPHALILSAGLADRLHVKSGDTVTIKLLEGNRAITSLKVYAIVNDYVGMFAYGSVTLINDLLNEDRLINVVSVTVDADYRKTLNRAVKELPKIAAITFKSSLIKTFQETFSKHILVFTSILTGFAIVIAISVVYNNVLISVRERSWELATLRVLGFTEKEVASLMFYHTVIEIICAIPLGIILGYLIAKLLLNLMQTDWFKIPFIIDPQTYLVSVLVVTTSGIVGYFLIWNKVKRLDLTSVLKVGD